MNFQLAIKRAFDILAASILLCLCAPLLAIVALLVKRNLGTPVFFRQPRIGKNERLFSIYKFRSMRKADNGDARDDARRLSPFGAKLRSTSLDELPELWNILTGDMSFVGPRPLLPEYLPYYSPQEKRRHLMRPGLTGLAQVSGRNALPWEERLALDVRYVDDWSLWLDVQILVATFGTVFSRRGISAEGHDTMPRLDDYRRKG